MASWKFFLNNIEVEEPIGWDGIEFTAQRTEEHGVDQPFSTEVSFYGKGAKLIKSLYDTQFINAQITIKIVSDVYVNGMPWEFNGFLNMALYSELNVCDTDSWQVSVGIIDDNFREKFKSRMDVDVDIYASLDLDGNPIADPVFDNTRLHTQEVYLVAYGSSQVQPYPIASYASLFWSSPGPWRLEDYAAAIPAYFSSNPNDFKGPFGTALDPQQVKWHPTKTACFINNSSFTRYFFVSARIKGVFGWNPNVGVPGDTANLELLLIRLQANPTSGANINYSASLDQSPCASFTNPSGNYTAYDMSGSTEDTPFPVIGLLPGEIIQVLVSWGYGCSISPAFNPPSGIGRELNVWVDECCLTITEKNGAEYASFAETMKAENFLKRLVNIITGNADGFVSDAFSYANNGCYWNYALTNGLKIRQAKTTIGTAINCDPDAVLPNTNFKVSFKQVFDGLSNIFCLGWTFEKINGAWKVRVEPVEYFYQNNIEFTALNVGEVRQSAKVEDLANQFKIGYDDTWKNIQAAGLWAIHTDRNYYVDNRAMAQGTTKKVELLSGIIAEGYAIEFSRRMYFFQDDSGSSDRPNDYELFIIWLNRNTLAINNIQNSEYRLPPNYNENGLVYIPQGDASMSSNRINQSNSEVGALYNINISPARNALRWWKVLGMHTYGLAAPKLKFQTGQYQIQYSSYISDVVEPCQEYAIGEVIAENMDIDPEFMRDESKVYLFKPIQIEFDYPQSLCDFINLSDNVPYGRVRLQSGSLDVTGWIESIANKPEDDNGGTTSFVLLAANKTEEPTPPPGIGPYNDAYNDAYL